MVRGHNVYNRITIKIVIKIFERREAKEIKQAVCTNEVSYSR